MGKLGPLADAGGRVAVQIRDLDQTAIGNPAHDLIRPGLSLASAARGSNLPGVTTAHIIEHLVAGYEAALMEPLAQDEATALAFYLAGVVGRAHGRQMDRATRDRWLTELGKARGMQLDAPSWLWSSVVELLSVHEAAYLDHCRRFVLSHAA